MCAGWLSRSLCGMNTPSRADRFAARLDRLPRGARSGLLALSIAASFAVVGSGAQAAPIQDGPTAVIVSGPAGLTTATDAHFVFVSDAPVKFQCSLDDAPFQICDSPAHVSGLEIGAHRFQVRALNKARVAGPPATRAWTVAAPPPLVPIPTPGPGWPYR